MKKIKLISVILALVLVISCFAACGGNTNEETTAAVEGDTTATEGDTTVPEGDTLPRPVTVPCSDYIDFYEEVKSSSVPDNFVFEKTGDGYKITGLTEKGKREESLATPGWYEGLPVVEIAPEAFAGAGVVKNLFVGVNILTIGDHAFAGCHRLENIFLGCDTRDVADSFAEDCPRLKKVGLDAVNHLCSIGGSYLGVKFYLPEGFVLFDTLNYIKVAGFEMLYY